MYEAKNIYFICGFAAIGMYINRLLKEPTHISTHLVTARCASADFPSQVLLNNILVLIPLTVLTVTKAEASLASIYRLCPAC